jgi:hypothetical protein
MGWFDDLQARVSESKEIATITDYLKGRAVDELVKTLEPSRGNLTAAELAQGQTGAPQNSQAIAIPAALQTDTTKILLVGGAVLVGLYLITRR